MWLIDRTCSVLYVCIYISVVFVFEVSICIGWVIYLWYSAILYEPYFSNFIYYITVRTQPQTLFFFFVKCIKLPAPQIYLLHFVTHAQYHIMNKNSCPVINASSLKIMIYRFCFVQSCVVVYFTVFETQRMCIMYALSNYLSSMLILWSDSFWFRSNLDSFI